MVLNTVEIRGPIALFERLTGVEGLRFDHGIAWDDGGDHVLLAYASDEAVDAIRALGLTVEVRETREEARQRLTLSLEQEGADAPPIDIA